MQTKEFKIVRLKFFGASDFDGWKWNDFFWSKVLFSGNIFFQTQQSGPGNNLRAIVTALQRRVSYLSLWGSSTNDVTHILVFNEPYLSLIFKGETIKPPANRPHHHPEQKRVRLEPLSKRRNLRWLLQRVLLSMPGNYNYNIITIFI